MFGLKLVAALMLFMNLTAMVGAQTRPEKKEQALSLHFTHAEALRLYDYLGQRANPQIDGDTWPIQYYGDTVNIGCSESPECFLNVYEKEWKFHREGGNSVYEFVMPIDSRILTGTIVINSKAKSLDVELTDIFDHSTFRFNQPIACQTADCSYTLGIRNWLPERQETQNVLDNAKRLILKFEGKEARTLYNSSNSAVMISEIPHIMRVKLGRDVYCFLETKSEAEYYCQASLQHSRQGADFVSPGFQSQDFSLIMRPTVQNFMLERFDLLSQSKFGKTKHLKICQPFTREGGTDCKHWYDKNYDISQPVDPIDPGGIAVGWGRTAPTAQ
ncbi:MAG TPA: hypothetical protein VE954_35225 [Oligoflexus sp.]|uniref:hypothetical protein n=1 Tax=Oligoflexus sp. TaxID=1971216 RepID=UPI002D3D20A5|nr:hypothetical protein [Oligoflexus sp.]HYX38385.1 hypothetical protein [Oligoflexus sp.]